MRNGVEVDFEKWELIERGYRKGKKIVVRLTGKKKYG